MVLICLLQAPVAASSWSGIRAGDKHGPACPQSAGQKPTSAYSQSEDCLYLNIYSPYQVK